jgi:hypothetical protein
MKNIHVLPTDKPSRLIYNDANQLCYQSNKSYKNDRKSMYRKKFNIYITTSEEIKDGDYFYSPFQGEERILKHNKFVIPFPKDRKIILTDNKDLIKDGVQAIDDEFLEWFVKNPSCEEVEVEKKSYIEIKEISYEGDFQNVEYVNYKIIIPQEDINFFQITVNSLEKSMNLNLEYINDEPLEAALSFLPHSEVDNDTDFITGFELGAEWQSERMYSEEDLREAFIAGGNSQIEEDDDYGTEYDAYMEEWFEQFKKK